MMQENRTATDHVILPGQGEAFSFGEVGGHFPITGNTTEQRFSVGELTQIPPHTLGAPLHRHQNEDEYAYVVSGRLSTMTGDEVVVAEPGTWLVKPRGQWHTFWNAEEAPCHVIEIVSPAGFESYFGEAAAAAGDMERLAEINEKYGIDMDFDSVPRLCERFGLTTPELAG
jgi:mannose-6-phosphate isomerase-like protein (cupin superfamily)